MDIVWISFPPHNFEKQEGVKVMYNASCITIQVHSKYKGIIFKLQEMKTEGTYLIIEYMVKQGLMDIYVISPTYNSSLILSSRPCKSCKWSTAVMYLTEIRFEKIKYIKIYLV